MSYFWVFLGVAVYAVLGLGVIHLTGSIEPEAVRQTTTAIGLLLAVSVASFVPLESPWGVCE